MANEVVETGAAIGNYKYDIIRGEKSDPEKIEKYGKYFFSAKVYRTFTFTKDGKEITGRDYSIPVYDRGFNEFVEAARYAKSIANRLDAEQNTTSASSAVQTAANAVNAASTDECPI